MKKAITYDDVLIIPTYSNIESRLDIDPRVFFLGGLRYPIISAPMDTVSSPRMVAALHEAGAYGILHRFGDLTTLSNNVHNTFDYNNKAQFGISIGVKDWSTSKQWLDTLSPLNIHSICIDVAHGHHELMYRAINNVKEWAVANYQTPYIIAGNVATGKGFNALEDAGADAIRVGIGPGSACTTRETTGVGVPQLTAIQEAFEARRRHTTIIADGGIQNPGDIAKALAAGADAVMLGKMLAGADETGTTVIEGRRPYRGQSLNGSNGSRGAPEGIAGTVPATGPVAQTIDQLMHYLRSSMSYVGADSLYEFRERAKFIRVSPATHAESVTRL